MTLVFSGFSFILHLAHHFANFRRSLRKSFAANCTFLLAALARSSNSRKRAIFKNWTDALFVNLD